MAICLVLGINIRCDVCCFLWFFLLSVSIYARQTVMYFKGYNLNMLIILGCECNYYLNSTVDDQSCNTGLCGVGCRVLCADDYRFNSAVEYQSVKQHWLMRCWL